MNTGERIRLVEMSEARKFLDPQILCYVEKTVIPEYQQNDAAHGVSHAKYVVKRAMRFAAREGANIQLAFIAAAYHDAMHHVDRKNHEYLSAEFFMNDEFLSRYLTYEERVIVKEAIEDHRSSLKGEPRSIYGKILSSADRTNDATKAIARTDPYLKRHFPDENLSQRIDHSYQYILEKYGPSGYVKTYIEDEDFNQMRKELIEILKDRKQYALVYMQACGYVERGING